MSGVPVFNLECFRVKSPIDRLKPRNLHFLCYICSSMCSFLLELAPLSVNVIAAGQFRVA